ncbi:MAG: hypothetical protein HUU06_07620 [Planctomycetaceae bacterium]|nr:hypothetical protein [Planctomycetota bacterium]NUN52639.1 hypothetical protein [Planctomycetaceae bacterium]
MESAEDPERKREHAFVFFPRFSDLLVGTSPWAGPLYDVSALPPLRIEVTETEDPGTWGPTDGPGDPEPDDTGEGGAHVL